MKNLISFLVLTCFGIVAAETPKHVPVPLSFEPLSVEEEHDGVFKDPRLRIGTKPDNLATTATPKRETFKAREEAMPGHSDSYLNKAM